MTEYRKYSIKQNRFKRSFLDGFEISVDDSLHCQEDKFHRLFVCDCIDGIEREAQWGRIHIDWDLEEDMVVILHAVAVEEKTVSIGNETVYPGEEFKNPVKSREEKIQLMKKLGAKRFVNQKDVLLYELTGRYLYFMIEVCGMGKGQLQHMFVANQGDVLNQGFEEVRKEYGSVYHRYMSVFSTLYMDFQDKIDEVSKILDIDTAPVELLPVFGRWMGLEVSNELLEEDTMRRLVKEAYHLNRIKGTKESLLGLCEIVLGERVTVSDRYLLQENSESENSAEHECGRFDVTILLTKQISEAKKSQLMFLLNQFKPVRSRIILKYQEQNMDGTGFENNEGEQHTVILDQGVGLDESIIIL